MLDGFEGFERFERFEGFEGFEVPAGLAAVIERFELPLFGLQR